jgi:hypothetical protein
MSQRSWKSELARTVSISLWGAASLWAALALAGPADAADWPVLKRYDQAHLARIALPLGGIGTGTVSLGGRGTCATGRS